MKFLYVARAFRWALNWLARHMAKWGQVCAAKLTRCIAYMNRTENTHAVVCQRPHSKMNAAVFPMPTGCGGVPHADMLAPSYSHPVYWCPKKTKHATGIFTKDFSHNGVVGLVIVV